MTPSMSSRSRNSLISVAWSGAGYQLLVEGVFDSAPDLVAGIRACFSTAAEVLAATNYADACPIETVALEVARRYALAELRRVDAEVRWTGLTGFGCEYLVLHPSDGRRVAFREFNGRRRSDEATSIVRQAAAYINEQISRSPFEVFLPEAKKARENRF